MENGLVMFVIFGLLVFALGGDFVFCTVDSRATACGVGNGLLQLYYFCLEVFSSACFFCTVFVCYYCCQLNSTSKPYLHRYGLSYRYKLFFFASWKDKSLLRWISKSFSLLYMYQCFRKGRIVFLTIRIVNIMSTLLLNMIRVFLNSFCKF